VIIIRPYYAALILSQYATMHLRCLGPVYSTSTVAYLPISGRFRTLSVHAYEKCNNSVFRKMVEILRRFSLFTFC